MDKKIKKRWLKALRSGKYEQYIGALHLKGDGYCCLGVLCDILRKDFPGLEWEETDFCPEGPGTPPIYSIFGEDAILPEEILQHAGLGAENSMVSITNKNDSHPFDLTELNDDGRTFEEIADIIEKYL